jgi:hypothetical protein
VKPLGALFFIGLTADDTDETDFWGARASRPPQDGFAVANVLVVASRGDELSFGLNRGFRGFKRIRKIRNAFAAGNTERINRPRSTRGSLFPQSKAPLLLANVPRS